MQPIIWIAIIGVAATGLGMGFLAPGFTLNVQQLGAQETLLQAPINTANVDFLVSKITGVDQQGHTVFKNKIVRCSFHTPTTLATGSEVFCKLTDGHINPNTGFGNIVAEGHIILASTLQGSTTTYIPISNVVFENANNVQNIEDVKIVVLGPKPSGMP